jgi:hypothetical protein
MMASSMMGPRTNMWNFITVDIQKDNPLHMRELSIILSTYNLHQHLQIFGTMTTMPVLMNTCRSAWEKVSKITGIQMNLPKTVVGILVTNKRRMTMKLVQKLVVLFGLVAIGGSDGAGFTLNGVTVEGL